MDILQSLVNAGGGAVIGQLAQKYGLDPNQARSVVETLLPALLGGVKNNTSAPGGLDSLLDALRGGNHQRYIDEPATLGTPENVEDGNGILGHIFGSKERSREVAAQASGQTGIGADILKKMLPVVAGLVMAQLSKKAAAAPSQAAPQQGGAGPLDFLSGILDGDGDGQVGASDVLGMINKLR